MTLAITLTAAFISTIVYWRRRHNDMYCLSALCFVYWGASLMWIVDAIIDPVAFFNPEGMVSDTVLGLCAVVLGIGIWIIRLHMHYKKKGDSYVSGI